MGATRGDECDRWDKCDECYHTYPTYRTNRAYRYSYRSATIGSSDAARRAGHIPKNMPITAENVIARIAACGATTVFHAASLAIRIAAATPVPRPMIPPAMHSTSASIMN